MSYTKFEYKTIEVQKVGAEDILARRHRILEAVEKACLKAFDKLDFDAAWVASEEIVRLEQEIENLQQEIEEAKNG